MVLIKEIFQIYTNPSPRTILFSSQSESTGERYVIYNVGRRTAATKNGKVKYSSSLNIIRDHIIILTAMCEKERKLLLTLILKVEVHTREELSAKIEK